MCLLFCIVLSLNTSSFENLHDSNVSWICNRCNFTNSESSLFQSYNLEFHNSLPPLNSRMASVDSVFTPENFSTPNNLPASRKRSRNSGTSTPTQSKSLSSAPPKKNWRTLEVGLNINGPRAKKAAMQSVCDYLQSDVIIGCETKITSNIFIPETLPPQYVANTYRKDRTSHGGGGGSWWQFEMAMLSTQSTLTQTLSRSGRE